MIYLVSDTISSVGIENARNISVEESIKLIKSWPVVQYDSETTGLDPRVCSLTCMQFGYKDFKAGISDQIVVDCNSINPVLYKKTIEKSYLIGHNLKFDLKFLYNYAITPLKIYDTMIIEQLLYLGYGPANNISYNLHDVLLRYTGIELDKSFQKEISKAGLTKEGIIYAANDVVHLQDIRRLQLETAKARKCTNATIVENRTVPAIAYMEWCGIKLDEKRWKEKMKSDKAEYDSFLERLDEYVVSNSKLRTKFIDTLLIPQCNVDWNSPSQSVEVLKELGFNTKVMDKETKEEKDSALEKLIITQKGIADDFLELYFGFKSAAKRVQSYGQNFLNQINPNTGRIHTTFKQFGTVTGRLSSGERKQNFDLAKLKKIAASEVGYSNMQNLPHDATTRNCFISEDDNMFLSCDYSAQESRVQADVWNEASLLDSFENGIDTHNLYAKLCFPEELKDIDVKDVKKLRPDLRQKAKSAEFAVSYGSDGTAIASTVGMSVDKARNMVANILKGMPGMVEYKKKAAKFLKKNGYIVINNITGHRIYWPEWGEWKAEEDRMDSQFWDEYRTIHAGTNDYVVERVHRHKAMGHDWFEKNVLNYPIQGGSAIISKEAAATLYEWVIKNGYFNKILFCVFVHDEIDCECPKEMANDFAKILSNIMQQAAAKYYKKLPIPAECSIQTYWEH